MLYEVITPLTIFPSLATAIFILFSSMYYLLFIKPLIRNHISSMAFLALLFSNSVIGLKLFTDSMTILSNGILPTTNTFFSCAKFSICFTISILISYLLIQIMTCVSKCSASSKIRFKSSSPDFVGSVTIKATSVSYNFV